MLYYEEEIIEPLLLSSANSTVTGNNASSAAGKSTGLFFVLGMEKKWYILSSRIGTENIEL